MTNSDTQVSQVEQLPLPGLVELDVLEESADAKSIFSDPAFANNKTLPIHRWVPWIAGFSSRFVEDALRNYLPEHATVLDPFSGVGTTLVEALAHGHIAVGFEVNPYAALACRAKCSIYEVDLKSFSAHLAGLQEFYVRAVESGYEPRSQPPDGFRTRAAFYSPKVLHKVLIALDYIGGMEDRGLQEFFNLAFASTMVRYSNYSYEPSLSRRLSSGKEDIIDFPVGAALIQKLRDMHDDIEWWHKNVPNTGQVARIIDDTFFKHAAYLKPESIDLVITSPPYLNNYHYNRNTRPQLYWLGYADKPGDLKELEGSNFGKYWQTVRGLDSIALEPALVGTEIETTIDSIRSLHPEKGVYGGSGWANYAATYFNDCLKLGTGIQTLLKPGCTALVVMGNSILQGVSIPTDEYFGLIAQIAGLELIEIHIPRKTRVGNSIIKSDVRVEKAGKSHKLYEAVIELRKR
jgi:hypothetical protein